MPGCRTYHLLLVGPFPLTFAPRGQGSLARVVLTAYFDTHLIYACADQGAAATVMAESLFQII